MHDLIHRFKISPPNTFTEMKEEEVRLFFQTGNALFERNWPYAWSLHQSADSPVKNKTGISSLPHFKEGKSTPTLGGWHIGISRFSKRKSDAWKLVKYITSYEVEKKLVLNLGWSPGRKDVYDDKKILQHLPHSVQLKKIFQDAVPRPNLPYYSQFSSIIQRYLHACISGVIPPGKALEEAEQELAMLNARYEKK